MIFKPQLDVKLKGETVWLNTKQMAVLFDKEESQYTPTHNQCI